MKMNTPIMLCSDDIIGIKFLAVFKAGSFIPFLIRLYIVLIAVYYTNQLENL